MHGSLHIDEQLLAQAQALSGQRGKSNLLNEALQEYVSRRQSANLSRLFGTVDFAPHYDYLKERRGK